MIKTEVVILASAILIFMVVLNLVRRRRLREEYSWLWLIAALFYLIMALKPDLIAKLSAFLGITNTITAFIFFSFLFIVQILIHYSVRLSKLTTQMKDVAQQLALLESDQAELSRLHENKDGKGSSHADADNQTTTEDSLPQLSIGNHEPGA